MGYCHEYYFLKEVDEFDIDLLDKVGRVINSFYKKGVICKSRNVLNEPIVNKRMIRFNGIKGCEDFILTPNTKQYHFTKTNLRKYDLVVCIVILLTKIKYKNLFYFDCDGFYTGELYNWLKAIKYVNKMYKRPKLILKNNIINTLQ